MAISEAHSAAARENGRKVRGPSSPEGLWRSAANAVKHGFTGAGTCLPEDVRVLVEAADRHYQAIHQPRDQEERELVRKIALNTVRHRRLVELRDEAEALRASAAVDRHDEAVEDAVLALAGRLESEPAAAVRLLRRSAAGCRLLAGGWADLGEILRLDGRLGDAARLRLLHLMGLGDAPSPGESGVAAEIWADAVALDSPTQDAEPPARARLAAAIEANRAALVERADDLWARHDGPARAAAPILARVDHSPEGLRLARYLAEAERNRRRALEDLARLRAGPRPPVKAARSRPSTPSASPKLMATGAPNTPRPLDRATPESSPKSNPARDLSPPPAVASPAASDQPPPTRNEPSRPAAGTPSDDPRNRKQRRRELAKARKQQRQAHRRG